MSSQTTVFPGQAWERRRTGVIREVAGFTTKPSPNEPSDGIRRARMYDPINGTESRVRVDQITKTYSLV